MTQSGLLTHPLIDGWLSFETPGRVVLRVGRVEIGQGVAVALARLAAEELDVDVARVDVIAGDTALCPNEGFTAGSLSIELSGPAIQGAASAARALFVAAARRPPTSIEDGDFLTDGVKTGESYWTLAAEVDLHCAIVEYARPKPRRDYRLIGRPGGGVDLKPAVTGAAFLHDLVLPGMLHGRVVRSPDQAACAPVLPKMALRDDTSLLVDGAFVGVIAAREQEAVRVARLLAERTRWSGPATGRPGFLEHITAPTADRGGGKSNERQIGIVASRDYIAHASIGPSCAIALWEGDALTVWTHSQGVFALRESLAKLFDLELRCVRVIHRRGSGCYGHNGADDAAADAAMLARSKPGSPVRVVWTRAQELCSAPAGTAMRTEITATLDEKGAISAMEVGIVSGSHARRPGVGGINLLAGVLRAAPVEGGAILDPPLEMGGGADRNAVPGYAIPRVRVDKKIVEATDIRTSSLRSLGAHVNVTAIEAVMDEAAAAANIDPVAYRLSHMTDTRARSVLERAARMARWPRAANTGVGYARYKNKAAYCAVVAEVELDKVVRVRNVWCAVDAGFAVDPDGVVNQIEGGILQSISWTLKESLPLVGGVPAAASWTDYPILGFDEIPEVEVQLFDRPDEPSLGVGEAAQGPAAAAVVNAVAAALGQRVMTLPVTRERILQALS